MLLLLRFSVFILLPFLVVGWIGRTTTTTTKIKKISTTQHHSLASFDFSSQSEWDEFYKQKKEEESNNNYQEDDVIEWHSSVELETIASFVKDGSRCLIPGCGNSNLPKVILSSVKNVKLVLQDSSQTCLDQLKERYEEYDNVEYHCGDATTMLSSLAVDEKFDIIIDKGLIDAILCGEGWNGPIKKLMKEVSDCLLVDTVKNGNGNGGSGGGQYLLVSYKMPTSTKEFLIEVGQEVGLTSWDFDLADYSNQRVSVSLARKI